MQPDRAIDEYASRQYGTFSRGQAESAGFTSRMIITRVQNGAWIRLAPSVYALASAPPKWERQMAAALLTREGSIVAGASAAYVHDFDGFGPGRPMILIGSGGNARSALAKVIRSERFYDVGIVRRKGFRVTDEAETVMSLAATTKRDRLEGLVDFLLARKSCTIDELARVTAVNVGTRGVARLRPIVETRLATAYQPPTTELERLLYMVLDDPGCPPTPARCPCRIGEWTPPSMRTFRSGVSSPKATGDAGILARPTMIGTDCETTKRSPMATQCFGSPTRCFGTPPRRSSTHCFGRGREDKPPDRACTNAR